MLAAVSEPRWFAKHDSFQAAVAFYPVCFAELRGLDAPLLVLHGRNDEETPAETCRTMQVVDSAYEMELVLYSNAGHVFDVPWSLGYEQEAADDAYARADRVIG